MDFSTNICPNPLIYMAPTHTYDKQLIKLFLSKSFLKKLLGKLASFIFFDALIILPQGSYRIFIFAFPAIA